MRLDDVARRDRLLGVVEQGPLGADDSGNRRWHRVGDRDGGHRPGRSGVDHQLDQPGGLQPHHGHAGLRRRGGGGRARSAWRRSVAHRGGCSGDRARRCSGVGAVSEERSSREQVIAGANNTNTQIMGATPAYATVHNVRNRRGRSSFSPTTSRRSRAWRCSARRLATTCSAPTRNAIGKRVRINGIDFLVIGVTVAKGGSGFNNQDDMIYAPLTAVQQLLVGDTHLSEISVASGQRQRHQLSGAADHNAAAVSATRSPTRRRPTSTCFRKATSPRRPRRSPAPSRSCSRRSPASRCWSAASAS